MDLAAITISQTYFTSYRKIRGNATGVVGGLEETSIIQAPIEIHLALQRVERGCFRQEQTECYQNSADQEYCCLHACNHLDSHRLSCSAMESVTKQNPAENTDFYSNISFI